MQGFFANLLGAAGSMHGSSALVGDLAPLLFPDERAAGAAAPRAGGASPDAPPTGAPGGPVAVRLEDVAFRYPRAGGDALHAITATLHPGEVVALVGPNGAGKSTLAALVLGLVQPVRGTLGIGDGPVEAGRPRASAVFQDFVRYTLPVRDNVGFGAVGRLGADRHLGAALDQAG